MKLMPVFHYTNDNDANIIFLGLKWFSGRDGGWYIKIVVLNFEMGVFYD